MKGAAFTDWRISAGAYAAVLYFALAGLIVFGALLGSAWLNEYQTRIRHDLVRHGLDRVLIGEVRISGMGSSGPAGLDDAESRVMAPEHFEQLRKGQLFDQVEVIETLGDMLFQDAASGVAEEVSVLMLSPKLMTELSRGGSAAAEALARGDLVLDAKRFSRLDAAGHGILDMPPADKAALRYTAPPMQFDYRVAPLQLPKGSAFLQTGAYLPLDHPEIKRSGLFAPANLWIRLRPGVEMPAAKAWLTDFFGQPGRLTLGGATMRLRALADRQAITAETVSAWTLRLRLGVSLAALLLLGGLALVSWGPVRREVALRRALGQPTRWALARVLRNNSLALLGGALLGAALALAAAWMLWAVVPLALALDLALLASLMLLSLLLLFLPAWRLAGQLPGVRQALGAAA